MEKPTMSHTLHLQPAKTPFYVEKFRFSSHVNWGTRNLICSRDMNVPKNWKRRGKSGKGKVRIDLFHTHPYYLTYVLRSLASKLFCFPLICKSLWQTSQTDTVKLRMDKLLQQWHFWHFSVYIESGVSVHVIQWKRVMRLYAFQTFSFPTWTALVIQKQSVKKETTHLS